MGGTWLSTQPTASNRLGPCEANADRVNRLGDLYTMKFSFNQVNVV